MNGKGTAREGGAVLGQAAQSAALVADGRGAVRGRITTCDHKIFELPELLSWDVRYTGSVPCDSYQVTFSYTAELEPVLRRAAAEKKAAAGTVQNGPGCMRGGVQRKRP